jgi:hypothetical protein
LGRFGVFVAVSWICSSVFFAVTSMQAIRSRFLASYLIYRYRSMLGVSVKIVAAKLMLLSSPSMLLSSLVV